MDRAAIWSRQNWFYLLLPLWLTAALAFRATYPWADQAALGEAATVFDWCLFMPALYALCYRRLPRRALLLRTIGIACGGLWLAGRIVPDPAEMILKDWGWLRHAGIAVVALFEGLAMIAVLRILFGAAPDPAKLERQGVPPVIARAMLAEARFWRWVWARLRGQ